MTDIVELMIYPFKKIVALLGSIQVGTLTLLGLIISALLLVLLWKFVFVPLADLSYMAASGKEKKNAGRNTGNSAGGSE